MCFMRDRHVLYHIIMCLWIKGGGKLQFSSRGVMWVWITHCFITKLGHDLL